MDKHMSLRPFNEIFNDPRTQQAMEDLIRRGLPGEDVLTLTLLIELLPAAYDVVVLETQEERTNRRANLASNIRALAAEIEDDREANYLRIYDHETVRFDFNNSDITFPKFSDFLRQAADEINTYKNNAEALVFYAKPSGKRSTRSTLEQFVRQKIAEALLKFLPEGGDRPLSAAAKLASASGFETTKQQMSEVFRSLSKK